MISAVVITKNEEKNIADCILSLKWCNEVIVIDDDSKDNTVKIAKKSGAKVFVRSLNGDFSTQRNFGLEKASHEWVFFVDADECVSDALAFEISGITTMQSLQFYSGFYLRRNDVMWGKQLTHGETAGIKLLRLARKNAGRWTGKVHEQWNIIGKTTTLVNPLMHYPHPTTTEFLHEINFYTDLRAWELYEKKVKSTWFTIILYPKGKFLVNFIFKLGFLDGLPGFVFAIFMSLHSFLVRAKLWLLWHKR